jgi:PAS domain-containing protein
MPRKDNLTAQVSVLLSETERKILSQESFDENRSISQIARLAIQKHIDAVEHPIKPGINGSIEEIFTALGRQLAKSTDILGNLRLMLFESTIRGGNYLGSYVSENATDITGYEKEDLLDGDFFMSRIHPQDRKPFITESKLGIQRGTCETTFRFKVQNGTYEMTRLYFFLKNENHVFGTWQIIPELISPE